MTQHKIKMRKTTNVIHKDTYLHVIKVGTAGVKVSVSKMVLLSITIIKRE